MIVEILTYVRRVVHDRNVVFRELRSWSDPRKHPMLAVSSVTPSKLRCAFNVLKEVLKNHHIQRKGILAGAVGNGTRLRR